MAAALARLVTMVEPLRGLKGLPPWLPRDSLWGAPHNALFDFGSTRRGAEWIERIATTSREVLMAAGGPAVIGHRDWSARNMRFRGNEVSVIYDWDSLTVGPEAILVGKTAIAFPLTWYKEPEPFPSPDAAAAFVREYETARGRRFSAVERTVVAAAAAYALSYTARCEHARDPSGAPAAGSAREALRVYATDALAALLAAG